MNMSNYSHSTSRPRYQRAAGAEERADFTDAGGPSAVAAVHELAADQDSKTASVAPEGTPVVRTLNTSIAKSWLAWQCKMIAGIIHGTLYFPTEDRTGHQSVPWMDGRQVIRRQPSHHHQARHRRPGGRDGQP